MATTITTVGGNGKYRAVVEENAGGVDLRVITEDGTAMVIFKFKSIRDILAFQHDIGTAIVDSIPVIKAA